MLLLTKWMCLAQQSIQIMILLDETARQDMFKQKKNMIGPVEVAHLKPVLHKMYLPFIRLFNRWVFILWNQTQYETKT